MSILLEYEKLFEPYTRDGHTLNNTIAFLNKEAQRRGISQDLVDLSIHETFLELVQGKTFPLDKCPCGCGIDKAGTAITHAMVTKLFEHHRNLTTTRINYLNERLNTAILTHMQADNAAFTAQYMKPGLFKRLKAKLKRKPKATPEAEAVQEETTDEL